MKKTIAILGGGNGAHTMAADLAMRGYRVRMYEDAAFIGRLSVLCDTLTIRCSGDTLDAVDGAAIRVSMPDGEQYEVGTVTGGETELWVDTDLPITFTVCGTGAILTETVDLSGDDAVWDLDCAETATITLIHDGEAPTEGTDGPVRFLGLEIDGFGEQLLDADGGSILVPPGEYSVTGYVYWCDGNYYSSYAKMELGTQNVTGEGLTLTLGSGAPVAAVSSSMATKKVSAVL